MDNMLVWLIMLRVFNLRTVGRGNQKLIRGRTDNTIAKKDKRTNNDLQNITQKTKDRVTPTPLKTVKERLINFCYIDTNLVRYLSTA